MRVAQIAPLWIPVPPRTYGGIELMLYHLVEELAKRKHDITLFASGDSKVSAKLQAPINQALWLGEKTRNPHAAVFSMLKMIQKNAAAFDIIHNHFGFFMFPLMLCKKIPPIVTTIHRPIDDFYAQAMRHFPDIHFCTLSRDAKKSAEEHGIPVIDVVPNGINPAFYPFNDSPEDYLLYLGRLNREKGIVTAIRVAKAANKKLVVAGNVAGTEEWLQFMNEVQPLLNQDGVNFVGQADFDTKIKLFRNAKALLFPIDRREPFGLVMIESMACGTPVIAFNKGSVPEIVKHGKNGFIVDTEEEMVEAVNRIGSINRADCRKTVEKKYTLDHMVNQYEKLYKKILDS